MNSSIWSSDRATHLRIVLVTAAAVLVVALVGLNARADKSAPEIAQVSRVVVKAGGPAVYSTNEFHRTQ